MNVSKPQVGRPKKYKPDNYIGSRFGNFVVLDKCSELYKNEKVVMLCKCDCGEIRQVTLHNLISGNSKSCGCLKAEKAASQCRSMWTDIAGVRAGSFVAVRRINNLEDKNYGMWECICDCGNTIFSNTSSITKGTVKKCPHCGYDIKTNHSAKEFKNVFQNKYGRLTVIRDLGLVNVNGRRRHKVECLCDCGNITEATVSNLKSGLIRSCGCLHHDYVLILNESKFIDISGQRFGKLVVVKVSEEATESGIIKWLCKCDCGNETLSTRQDLINGDKYNCGCERIFSKGENLVSEVLDCIGIKYAAQYIFKECKYKDCLIFDFYIDEIKVAIEYQGAQHYYPVDFAGKGEGWAEEQLAITKLRDQIKRDYCATNNIRLIEIPYWKLKEVPVIIKDLISSAVVAVSA